MFCKTCLPHLPGWVAKSRCNHNRILTRLERWAAGERASLWSELPQLIGKRNVPTEQSAEQSKERRQQRAIALDQHGVPGKAVKALVSAGLAPDTEEVEDIMRSKFPEPPPTQAASSRPPAPPSNELSEEVVAKAVLAFPQGAGAGPSGARPDFIRQIIGKKGNKRGITPIVSLCNLLADGRAPPEIRPYLGGANGFAFKKDPKPGTMDTGQVDARPVCSGDVWR